MKRIKLSETGPEFSDFAWGAWRLADQPETTSVSAVRTILDQCLEVGITTVDHADIYGDYRCEEIFGKVLQEVPQIREKLEIVSKCGIKLVSKNRSEHRVKHYDCSKAHIVSSVDRSLKNLNCDYLDLLLIHRPDPLMDPVDTAAGLDEVIESGKVKHVGVSNFLPWQVDLLNAYLKNPVVTNQVEWSVWNTSVLHDGTVGQCQSRRFVPMAWSPLGGGSLFTEKSAKAERLRQVLGRIADRSAVSMDLVALQWLKEHPAGVVPIVGTIKTDRIQKLSNIGKVEISREEWHEIWSASTGTEVP